MVMHLDGRFYDTYAFVRNGVNFTNEPPFYADLNGSILQMDSVGSCIAMNGALAKHLIWPEEDVVVGLCAHIYALGASVWLDSSLSIKHA
jgi:hypothetical protein